ncbi:MAG: DNA mismatch repair endonuclease MutL [Planctomycetota bacterium]
MIRELPPIVVNQIAAGEVIERPFSVVKELIENSLDAGATRVRVELEAGGIGLIRVIDDGMGFTPGDLVLAFRSHATSKLAELADLERIASYGFRGEALASIGSVARAAIRSRRHDAESGHAITCEGGTQSEVQPFGCPPGTVVEARDLFFNTPARRRFLRTPDAERARIEELLVRLALARLDVDFTLVADGRERVRFTAGESLRDRVTIGFGDKVSRHLVDVTVVHDDYRVEGLIGTPDAARRDQTLGLLWVNGRLVRDRSAAAAIRQAQKAYLMPGMHPVHFLFLALPPHEVDVNVHPTKAEVRFLGSRRVGSILHEASTHGVLGHGRGIEVEGALRVAADKPAATTGFPDLPRGLFGEAAAPSSWVGGLEVREAGRRDELAAEGSARGLADPTGAAERPPAVAAAAADRLNPFAGSDPRRFVQILDLYLVFEGRDGLIVVDQHALHERVLYERLLRAHDARGEVAIQRLLVPEVVELTPSDKVWVLEQREALAAEGFLVDDFGGRAVAVFGIPAVLARAVPRRLLLDLLGGDREGDLRPRARAAVVERFHSMACRAAVMAGDRLGDDEIEALLREAATLDHPHNCPHGRPTVLQFSAAELERFFRRRGGPSSC